MFDNTIALIMMVMILLITIVVYNGLIHKRNRAEQAFSTIDIMLKKRSDLVPALVATVQEYMRHESDVFTKIAELRSNAGNPVLDYGLRVEANNELGRLMCGVIIQAEQYPELKAGANFLHLQHSLNEIEEQLAASRRAFNATVTEYNIAIEMFPTSLLAWVFAFTRKPLLEVIGKDDGNPNVKDTFSL